ncbi:hypothetical protein HHL22_19285 [Hymenobacter sp. RP-2-7]|uniref:DUF6799 domain-containing protein n=1 Tax=Hymenobacter polaris TaxID=2682546 RepID=A0A7Y0FP77_9BACT|nr:DUF6799 domain-containing protein [Hymenobacter polaris]NML67351.1 hypothetical protein [Hymenobacter polaris]
MKSFPSILASLALVASASLAHAQAAPAVAKEEGHMPTKHKRMESRGRESGVMMHGGQMMQMQDGKMMPMAQEMTMSNGTKVATNGQVTMAGGKTMMLQDGEGVSMGGQVMHHGGKKGKMMGGGKMSSSM